MVTKGKKKGTVRFSIKQANDAVKVYLAGAFRGWEPMAMRKQKDGSFALEVTLPPGKYEYKFFVDGQWMADSDHSHTVPNPFGSVNSVACVE